MSQRSVSGRDLYEVLLADYPARPTWEGVPLCMRLIYEKAAQALNVRLGLCEASHQTILIAHENSIVPVCGLSGLACYIDAHLVPHDRFEAHLIEHGQEVGYGWYEIAMNRHLITYEERGKARDLAERFTIEPIPIHQSLVPLDALIHRGGQE